MAILKSTLQDNLLKEFAPFPHRHKELELLVIMLVLLRSRAGHFQLLWWGKCPFSPAEPGRGEWEQKQHALRSPLPHSERKKKRARQRKSDREEREWYQSKRKVERGGTKKISQIFIISEIFLAIEKMTKDERYTDSEKKRRQYVDR